MLTAFGQNGNRQLTLHFAHSWVPGIIANMFLAYRTRTKNQFRACLIHLQLRAPMMPSGRCYTTDNMSNFFKNPKIKRYSPIISTSRTLLLKTQMLPTLRLSRKNVRRDFFFPDQKQKSSPDLIHTYVNL